MTSAALIRANDASSRIRLFGVAPAPLDLPVQPDIPSAAELEVARLHERVAELEAAQVALDREWRDTFDTRLADASRQIELDHRDDDRRRIDLLEQAIGKANASLDQHLLSAARRSGLALACYALSRFAELRADDATWLADIVAAQVDRVGAAMIVAVKLNPADLDAGTIASELEARLNGRSAIKADPAVTKGSVRLHLRLGDIDIDPAQGLHSIIAALADEDSAEHA